jgi:hypothetical protein
VGDYVLKSTSPEWEAQAVNPDVDYVIPTIQEIAESLPVVFNGMPTSTEDFHGDGTDGEVYVVRTHGLLSNGLESLCPEHAREVLLGYRDIGSGPLHSLSSETQSLEAELGSSHSVVSSLGHPQSLFLGGLGHASVHPLRTVAGSDPMFEQDTAYNSPADSEGFCESLLACSSEIVTDQIISIRREPFSGHVYNLDSVGGYYISNSILAHNCRCSEGPA